MAQRQRRSDPQLSASRLRVLFVGHRFPPDGSGGYELHCAAVRRHLLARGHAVRVLVAAGEGEVAADEPGVRRTLRRVAPGEQLDRPRAWAFERHNRAALDAELDAFAADVVCFWRLAELSLSLVERVRERGVPALGYVGDGWLYEGVERDPWTPYRGRPIALGGAADWVFNSRWLREATGAAGVAIDSPQVLSPGVDRRVFRPREPRDWRGNLLYAGRLTPAKGVDVALRALAQIPGARLQLVGDGPPDHVAELERLAGALGIPDRLTRRPAVAQAELATLYRAADAVLFPVRWQEPFGLVPLEAMACGVPVVATGTGGSAEYLVPDGNALVVAPEDPGALAEAIARLSDEPGLRERLRRAGMDTAARHDRDASSAELERRLSDLSKRAVPGQDAEEAAG